MPANPVRRSIAEMLAKNTDELSQLRLPRVVVELLKAADAEIERLEAMATGKTWESRSQ